MPIGYDHDGAVGNPYGLGLVCPTLTFADRDGRVVGTHLGFLDEAALEDARRARSPPTARHPSWTPTRRRTPSPTAASTLNAS